MYKNDMFLDNFTMLCSMVIRLISMCFRIFLPPFRRVWFSSDDFAQSYRHSNYVYNVNPGHVKGVYDVNEVAIFWLMNFAFREVHFLSKYSPKKAMDCLYRCISSSFIHILILSLIILCSNVSCRSSSRGSLINVNIFSVTFDFDPRPVSSRIKSTLSLNLLYHLKHLHE